eukprot:scaffold14791_cov122-Amphora_coffeaeformis.AAC.1
MAPMVIVTIVLLVFVANLTLFDTIDPELTAVLLLAAAQESQPINGLSLIDTSLDLDDLIPTKSSLASQAGLCCPLVYSAIVEN